MLGTWFSKYKKIAWNAGLPIADTYEMNNSKQGPTLPHMKNRTNYSDFVAGDNVREPASGNSKTYPDDSSLIDVSKDDRLDPLAGEENISPGTTIIDDGSAFSEHYHKNKFVDPEEYPRMTDDKLPKTITGRLRQRVPIKLR